MKSGDTFYGIAYRFYTTEREIKRVNCRTTNDLFAGEVNPTLELGMNANWYGLNKYLKPKLITLPPYIPLPERHVIFGMRGGPRELHTDPQTGKEVPFALTEEFVSVYRMHTLLPDSIEVVSPRGQCVADVPLADTRNAYARTLTERHGLETLLFSFGVGHPGDLVLNNYPALLQNLRIPHAGTIDMGAVDVLRDRERGVPRYNEFRRQFNLMPLDSIDELGLYLLREAGSAGAVRVVKE